MPASIDDGIAKYIKLRDAIAAKKKAHEEALKPFNDALEMLENWLLDNLQKMGADHVATANGTVYKVTRSSASVKDWDAALNFIKENDLWGILDQKVSKKAIEEFMTENNSGFPGVEINRIVKLNVRR